MHTSSCPFPPLCRMKWNSNYVTSRTFLLVVRIVYLLPALDNVRGNSDGQQFICRDLCTEKKHCCYSGQWLTGHSIMPPKTLRKTKHWFQIQYLLIAKLGEPLHNTAVIPVAYDYIYKQSHEVLAHLFKDTPPTNRIPSCDWPIPQNTALIGRKWCQWRVTSAIMRPLLQLFLCCRSDLREQRMIKANFSAVVDTAHL